MTRTYCNYISRIDRSKSSSKLEQSFLFFNVQTDLDSKQERKKERKKEYQHVLLNDSNQNPQEKNLQRPKFKS